MKVSIKNLPVTNRSALNKIKKGFGYSFQTLLSPPEANPKIKKNNKVGVLTVIVLVFITVNLGTFALKHLTVARQCAYIQQVIQHT